MKGVDDYIKIGQDKFKNHPSFKDLYTKQKRDLSKSVGALNTLKYTIQKWDRKEVYTHL